MSQTSRSRRFSGQITTPTSGRREKRRRICGADVAHQVMTNWCSGPSTSSPRNRGTYQPNQSLYDGIFHGQSEESDEEQENFPPLTSSSYNARGRHDERSVSVGPTSAELVKMMQEQQQLLHQLLETQKKMELKQEEFDVKLQQLSKLSESSSSSPDSSQKKKFKISRNLTVCYVDIALCRYSSIVIIMYGTSRTIM